MIVLISTMWQYNWQHEADVPTAQPLKGSASLLTETSGCNPGCLLTGCVAAATITFQFLSWNIIF